MSVAKLETTAALHTDLVALDENGSRLDALIVGCCETVQAIAWSFALGSSFTVDVEDLYSIGMVAVCAAAARAVGLDKPMAYLYSAAKHAMINEWRRVHECSIESLDALLSDEGSLSLIDDVLPPPPPDASVLSRRLCALHAAMLRLTRRRQEVLRRRFGLPGYGMHTIEEAARDLHTTLAAVDRARRDGLRSLRRDAALCEVMGVEVER